MGCIRYLFVFVCFVLAASYVYAAPQIIIVSPENIVYDSSKIFLNVTSNETADFFIKDARGQRELVLLENTSELTDYLYLKEGKHEFRIWARNNNGETNASVFFNSSVSNPVNVISCGFLFSSNTEYILSSNISSVSGYRCIHIVDATDVNFNLNENTIECEYCSIVLQANWCSNVEIYNGTIKGGSNSVVLDLETKNINFIDVNVIGGYAGIYAYAMQNALFERVSVNSPVGFWFETLNDVSFVNSTFTRNGGFANGECAFKPFGNHATLVLEEFKVNGFKTDFCVEGGYTDFYFRNTKFNMSKSNYPNWPTSTRFYRQHKVIIDVSDQLNKTGSGVIQIKNTIHHNPNKFREKDNPTGNLLIATDENGRAETWLTEKLFIAKTSSPPVIEDIDFSEYNITAKTWNGEETTVQLSLASNTTIPVSIQISVPVALPECTISQLLDLNNDNTINIQDAVIILRYISGLPVTSSGSKECTGISLNPF